VLFWYSAHFGAVFIGKQGKCVEEAWVPSFRKDLAGEGCTLESIGAPRLEKT